VFLPNPYHRDEHQRHNAQPMVEVGGAAIARDRIEVAANLAEVVPTIIELLRDRERRMVMHAALTAAPLRDGATILADWISASVPQ
jgi:UDP-N-acetylglucosamine:LPS N-acetylglucosamine transferase